MISSESSPFSAEEMTRYNRHFNLPGFGFEAQKKLKMSRVLVVGAGGLGSPLLLYLAAAGVGTLGIVDFDVIEESNLQRQVLFGVENIGQSKAEAAKNRLESLNPHLKIELHPTRLTSENALEILKNYDLVADGTDNFPTRYLINDAAVLLGKPVVFAAIFQFEGQVSVFNWRDRDGILGPNYRDLFPSPPSPGIVQNCAESGVLGVLPGIIGSLQACEVIKIISGLGEPLSGRLFHFDALAFEMRTLKIKRRSDNSINGDNPAIIELIDYEQFCGLPKNVQPLLEITADEFLEWKKQGKIFQLIDVREQSEFEVSNLDGLLIPLKNIEENIGKVSREIPVVVHCQSGQRSAKAIQKLESEFGFGNLFNLKGGVRAVETAQSGSIKKAPPSNPS